MEHHDVPAIDVVAIVAVQVTHPDPVGRLDGRRHRPRLDAHRADSRRAHRKRTADTRAHTYGFHMPKDGSNRSAYAECPCSTTGLPGNTILRGYVVASGNFRSCAQF